MSSQLEDYFEEAVETVARLLYVRNQIPREPDWVDLEPRMKECAIRDARVVIDLWIKVSAPCLWCHGTGRTADLHQCRACGGVGFERFDAPDRPPFFTEQQERALARCEGYEEGIAAASPDERLREALALVYVMLTGAEPMWAEMPLDERCARAANEAQQAVLAADREAPDERGVCDIHGPGIEPCECEDNILPQAAPEYRPEDFA